MASRVPDPDPRVEEADWYSAALAGFGGRVECVLPRGYTAYARILHPALLTYQTPVRWAEVAAHTGRALHPLAQFTSLAGRWDYNPKQDVGWPGDNPEEGTLDAAQLRSLCTLLADHTTTADQVWLTVWVGWGDLPKHWHTAPRVEQPHRSYYLFRSRLDAIVDFAETVGRAPGGLHSPAQWWPNDRAWCVATEVDFDSTLVGGTSELIDSILNTESLEAFPVAADDDLTIFGDHINPSPPGHW